MTFICTITEIPEGKARDFDLDGENIIVVKQNGQIYVYRNCCPHLGIPLNWEPDNLMDSEDDLIKCSTHGALFLIDNGKCISGPCAGQSLQAKPFHIQDNNIHLNPN